jgi:hypothetical protein
MAELGLYQKPVRLNRFAHAALRYTPPANYLFSRTLTGVPVMGVEFPAACRQYPIVFVRAEGGGLSAQAVLSVQAEENAFVDRQGQWTATYIPAFVRRYPFVLAEIPGNPSDFDVAFDEASDCFSPDHGEALFADEKGEPSPLLKSQVEFLRSVQIEHGRTQEFLKELESADLLIPRNVDIVRADKQRFGLRNAMVVDETRLSALPPDKVQAYLGAGYLGWIYAHLISLQCFLALANRAGQPLEDLVPWWAK